MGSEPKRMVAIIKDPQHGKRIAESLQLFNGRQDYMDLCFVCARGHRVYAHKLLLSSVSTQLKKMFLELPDCIEIITIHLPDIEARILRLMLDFLYEGALKLVTADYNKFKNLQDLLGIVLQRSGKANQQQLDASQTQQPVQPQAIYYVQASGPNSQGQMQYVLAAPATLSQGQMMQMSQAATSGQMIQVTQAAASGQIMQVNQAAAPGHMVQVNQAAAPGHMQVPQAQAPGQVIQVAASNTSMPQGQIMQMAPSIINQASGQMVQGGTTMIQRNNMLQVAPHNNAQVVPMVAGNQMVQCSSQMVVEASQPTIINNNQMQSNIQNQAAQSTQRPQYVMASTNNQMTTSRARAPYTQPQTTPQERIAARSRATTQVAQPIRNNANNSVRTRRMMRAPVPMAQNRSITATRTIQRSRHSAQ